MTKDKLVAVRLDEALICKLEELQGATGMNQSQVIRELIKSAQVIPVVIESSVKGKDSPILASTLKASQAPVPA